MFFPVFCNSRSLLWFVQQYHPEWRGRFPCTVSHEFRSAAVLSLPFKFPFRRGLKIGKDYEFAIDLLFKRLMHVLCLNHCKMWDQILVPLKSTDIFISDLRQSRIVLQDLLKNCECRRDYAIHIGNGASSGSLVTKYFKCSSKYVNFYLFLAERSQFCASRCLGSEECIVFVKLTCNYLRI